MIDFLFYILLQGVIWLGLCLALLILMVVWLVIALFILGYTLEMTQRRRVRKEYKKGLAQL